MSGAARPSSMQRQQKQQRHRITAVTALALFTLAACGTESGPGDGEASVRSESPVSGVRWNVESVRADGRTTPGVKGTALEIGAFGKAQLSTGCDEYAMDVTVRGDTLTVGEKHRTAVADCVLDLAPLTQALDKAVAGTLKAEVRGERLTLTSADGDVVKLASGPPPGLTGTRWAVTSLTSDGRVTLPAGAAGKAYFTFGKDGSVAGRLDCNSFRGSAEISGDTITFGRLISTKVACAGPGGTVARHVQQVLENKVTYVVSHGGLLLTPPEGDGLAAVPAKPAAKRP